MELVALVTLLIVIQYFAFIMMCGAARAKSGVEAPAISGDPVFERALRVQQNTAEQLMVVLPLIWLCANYFRADVAAICGAVFLVGRFMYRAGYMADPNKRFAGMMTGILATAALILTTIWGIGSIWL